MGSETKHVSIRMSDRDRTWYERYGSSLANQLREDRALLEKLIDDGRREIAGKFSVPEACLVTDAMNGCMFEPRLPTKSVLLLEISDSIKLNRLDEKWKVDGAKLMATLQELSELGTLAVIHSTRSFWASVGGGDQRPNEEMIREFWPGMPT